MCAVVRNLVSLALCCAQAQGHVHFNRTGAIGVANGAKKRAVYVRSSNSMTRTTRKETKMHGTCSGYLGTYAMARGKQAR
jgi:hypothetical protein